MKPNKRQKLCHNCEGDVDIDVIVCPLCAADLREEKPEQKNPPSFVRHLHNQQVMQTPSAPSFPKIEEQEAPPPASEANLRIFPMILFVLGVPLCLLGLLMFFFSDQGQILMKWNARYWIVYIAVSIPLLIFGYRKLGS